METSLKAFRDEYLETLLRFLWREWTALGVAGQDRGELRHVVDPEALLLFTCSLGRYDQRLFDEVMDWLTKNGRFLNIQRMRNILRREPFTGGEVLSAVADWMSQYDDPTKWKLLAKRADCQDGTETLFYLPDGRPLPQTPQDDTTFLKHGFIRSPVTLRGYAQSFPPDATPCQVLKLRALLGVNARCDVLVFLAMSTASHPREIARELYYSQKAIHDIMTNMACSGMLHSSRATRERIFRPTAEIASLVMGANKAPQWINWPILLSTAETIWKLVERLCLAQLDPLLESSEIALTMKPLMERLTRTRWAPPIPSVQSRQGLAQLQAFLGMFQTAVNEPSGANQIQTSV